MIISLIHVSFPAFGILPFPLLCKKILITVYLTLRLCKPFGYIYVKSGIIFGSRKHIPSFSAAWCKQV